MKRHTLILDSTSMSQGFTYLHIHMNALCPIALTLSLRNFLAWFYVINFCTNFKGMTFQYIYLYNFLINYDNNTYYIPN